MRTTRASSFCCLLTCVLMLCGIAVARADSRIALVIGNSRYISDALVVPNAARDAADVAAVLKKNGFDVVLKFDLTKDAFESTLADFDRASRNYDVALVYYAGHGVQYRGQNFLLPTDKIPRDNQDIKYKSIALSELLDAASYARKAKIIILDACRNTLVDRPTPGTRSVTGVGDHAGLASIEGSDGMIVFFSAQPGKTALDSVGGANSPFADSLARRLGEPGRDIKEIFTEVTADVRSATLSVQEPETVTTSLTERIVLSPEETAEDAYQKIYRSDDPEILKAFIRRFPDSYLADAAQNKLDKLDLLRRAGEQEAEAQKRAAIAEQERKQREALEAQRAEAETQRQLKEDADAAAREQALAELRAQKEAAEARIAAERRQAEDERARIAAEVEQERLKRQLAEEDARRKAEQAARAEDDARRAADEAGAFRKAEQERDEARREDILREAEGKAIEAQAAADAARKAQDEIAVAKAEEEARQARATIAEAAGLKAEQERIDRIKADACVRDLAQLDKYRQAKQIDLIEALGAESICPGYPAAADKAIRDVRDALAKACDVDQKAFARIDARNEDALKAALASFTCGAVRKAANDTVARLEQDKVKVAVACSDERISVNAIDPSLRNARQDYLSLRVRAVCPETPKAIDQLVQHVDARVASAQDDLVRLGCLDKASGRFDDATVAGLSAYLKARNAPAETIRITDGLVAELGEQVFRVCAPPAGPDVATTAARPAPSGPVAPGPGEPSAKPVPGVAAGAPNLAPAPRRILAAPPKPRPQAAFESAAAKLTAAPTRSAPAATPHGANPVLNSPPVGISF